MNDEYGNPIEPGLEQPSSLKSTGGLKDPGGLKSTGYKSQLPVPKVTKIVHGNVERLTNPASSLKITSGLGTQVKNNGNEIVLATQAMPLDVWQAVPEVPKADESEIIERFDNPLGLSSEYAVAPNDEWHKWTTAAGNKTETYLGVTVRLGDRTLTFDSTGKLVKVTPKFSSAADSRYLHPWQCYITASSSGSVSLKVNPVSTLMQTFNNRAYWKDSTWKDRKVVTNFTDTFTIINSAHVVWLEVEFDSAMIMGTATVKSGARWDSNLTYVSADNVCYHTTAFTWRQLLAYFKPSANAGGSEVDAVFSGTNYKLMCPTTTHLAQGYFAGAYGFGGGSPAEHTGLVPWFGCVWEGSS